jgi:XTP/dITP diphosphohydrolase
MRRQGRDYMMLLVVGTRNRKKREEILDLIGDLGIEVADLTRFPEAPEVDEDGATFEANARKKAAELARALGQWVLGEDSGLVVPGLGGQPGVYSARYAGDHGDDDANNAKLLAELARLPADQRATYYVCACAVADPGGTVRAVAEGRCHGVIASELRGGNGFGYDPLFIVPEYHRTFGELSPLVKRVLSHRARALASLRVPLRLLAGPS